MKKILFIEDNWSVFEMLKNQLDETYEIVRVRAVDEAIGATKFDGPFDCYVIDLQILSFGLDLSEKAEYQNRQGYAFIKKHLWKDKTAVEVKEIKSKIIICSRYVTAFSKEYRDEIKGMYLVDKTTGYEKIVASLIRKICER